MAVAGSGSGNLVCVDKITRFLTPTVERATTINRICAPSEPNGAGMPRSLMTMTYPKCQYLLRETKEESRLCCEISLDISSGCRGWVISFRGRSFIVPREREREESGSVQLKNFFISIYLFNFVRNERTNKLFCKYNQIRMHRFGCLCRWRQYFSCLSIFVIFWFLCAHCGTATAINGSINRFISFASLSAFSKRILAQKYFSRIFCSRRRNTMARQNWWTRTNFAQSLSSNKLFSRFIFLLLRFGLPCVHCYALAHCSARNRPHMRRRTIQLIEDTYNWLD